ncbi:hypothetical protein ACWGB8_24670 [Kitasatospora sp. NPDC054939]
MAEAEDTMAVVVIFEAPGMTQALYEQSVEKLTGVHGPLKAVGDLPVPGLLSHTAAPTSDGWLIVDVWESEEAFQRFGEVVTPIMNELGVQAAPPRMYPVFTMVTG